MKEKKEYYKNMIYRIGLISSVKNNDINDYNVFLDLFKNHPEYPQKIDGIIDVCIVRNKMNPKYYELNIIKEDGTIDNISYLSCCKVQHDEMKNLKSAMRYAIKPQIDHYRSNNVNVCQSCNSSKNIEIDHFDPSFKKLYTDFIEINPNIPKEFQDTYFNSACFKEEDREFEESWCQHHLKYAKLQCLCKKCNLSKKRF
jgi:hypothetical protein